MIVMASASITQWLRVSSPYCYSSRTCGVKRVDTDPFRKISGSFLPLVLCGRAGRGVSSASVRILGESTGIQIPLCFGPIRLKVDRALAGSRMKTLSAKDAKYGIGRLIDLARAEQVAIAKHGQPVVVGMAVEKYERLKVFETGHVDSRPSKTEKTE